MLVGLPRSAEAAPTADVALASSTSDESLSPEYFSSFEYLFNRGILDGLFV